MKTGFPSTVPGISALIRFGSVYIDMTRLFTVFASSERKMALFKLLDILVFPSVPTSEPYSETITSGTGKVSPYR